MYRAIRVGLGVLLVCAVAACASHGERADTSTDAGGKPSTTDVPSIPGDCENGSLRYGPRALPPATRGATYEVRLSEHAEPDWRGAGYHAGTLPPGFDLEGTTRDTLTLRGVPAEAGSFELTVYAIHDRDSNGCSTMPDPHTFHLDVVDGDAGADADASADASP